MSDTSEEGVAIVIGTDMAVQDGRPEHHPCCPHAPAIQTTYPDGRFTITLGHPCECRTARKAYALGLAHGVGRGARVRNDLP